jgi:hypothetical protein
LQLHASCILSGILWLSSKSVHIGWAEIGAHFSHFARLIEFERVDDIDVCVGVIPMQKPTDAIG